MSADAHAPRMKRKAYEKELGKLQVELCHLQEWAKANKLRVIVLFEGRNGRAGAPLQGENRRSAAAMETEPDGYGILPTMVRLFGGAGPDAEGDQHATIAMVHHSLRRQAPGTAELHRASAEIDPAQTH